MSWKVLKRRLAWIPQDCVAVKPESFNNSSRDNLKFFFRSLFHVLLQEFRPGNYPKHFFWQSKRKYSRDSFYNLSKNFIIHRSKDSLPCSAELFPRNHSGIFPRTPTGFVSGIPLAIPLNIHLEMFPRYLLAIYQKKTLYEFLQRLFL